MDFLIIGSINIGLTYVLQTTFGITKRYKPLLCLIIAFGVGALYVRISHEVWTWTVIQNTAICAFMSMGIWSGIKTSFSKKNSL